MGEKNAATRAAPCNFAKGIKIPLMKIKGKRTRLENIIIWEGERRDGEESKTPSEEKQKEERRILGIKNTIFVLE
jgi:hypothetical protein